MFLYDVMVLLSLTLPGVKYSRGFDTKIAQSRNATRRLPFLVVMMYEPPPRGANDPLFRGVSLIIHPQFTITACRVGLKVPTPEEAKDIAVGDHNLSPMEAKYFHGVAGSNTAPRYEENYQKRDVSHFYPNPNCKLRAMKKNMTYRFTVMYDLGAFRFLKPFGFTRQTVGIMPMVPNPSKSRFTEIEESIENGTSPANCTVYGMGGIEENRTSKSLKEAHVKLYSETRCAKDFFCYRIGGYDTWGYRKCIRELRMFKTTGNRCAESIEGNEANIITFTDGDAGGPIMCTFYTPDDEKTPRVYPRQTMLIGIVSTTYGNIFPERFRNFLSYQPLSIYFGFINKVMKEHHGGVSFLRAPPFVLILTTASNLIIYLLL